VKEINAATEYVQIAGVLLSFETLGQKQESDWWQS
jgi:hypothetical protein